MILSKSINHWLCLLTSMILIITCEPSTKAPTTGDIEGTILDAATSQPISGATVTTEPITSSKTTDSEGTYLIEGIEPETYTIQSSKAGYTSNTTTVSVVAGETASADLQLVPLGPELSVSTTLINFGTASNSQTFSILNSGVGTLSWSIISNANWVTINPASGTAETETDVVTVSVDRTAMSFGNHYETITVATNANSKTIDLVMTIPNPNEPQLSIAPLNLDFGTSETQMTFNLSNTGTGMLTWNITDDQAWISVDPQSGTTETGIDEIVVNLDRLGHAPGIYNGVITVSSDGGNQAATISMIIPDEPTLILIPTQLDFGGTETALSFDVANAGSGELNWSVTDNQEWITASPTSGTNYGTVNVSVSRDGLPVGDYGGLITVSSDGGSDDVSILMNVPADQPPTAVQLQEPTDATETSLTLQWTRNFDSDFAAYKVYRDNTPAVTQNSELIATLLNSTDNAFTNTGLQSGTIYYYRVYVMDAAQQHSSSNVVTGKTLVALGTWSVVATLGTNLRAIDILNENYVIAVGESGKIFYFDGSIWTEEMSPATGSINDVEIISQTEIWAASSPGILRYDGISWTMVASTPSTSYYSIGRIADSLWFGSTSGTIDFYYDSYWSTTDLTGDKVWDIKMLNSNEGYAVEEDGSIYRYNGVGWSINNQELSTTSNSYWAQSITAFSENNIWVGGFLTDYLFHWDGSTMETMWDGTLEWETGSSYPTGIIRGIDGLSSTDIWFVGSGGTILHWDGNQIQDITSPTESNLYDVKMVSTNDGWAVGNGGVVLRYSNQ